MNCAFYLAIDRLPLSTVAAIEFVPVVLLAALGARTARNALAVVLAVAGVALLSDVVLEADPLGLALAALNAALFAAYVVLGHRVARSGAGPGIEGLGAALARLPRASYALLVALLPATATVVGVVVLAQVPSPAEAAGVALVVAAVAAHRPADREDPGAWSTPAPSPTTCPPSASRAGSSAGATPTARS